MTVKYIITAKEWFDKVNGNSYFSCRIESTEDRDFLIKVPFQHGYGDQARHVAITELKDHGLILQELTFPSEMPIHYTMVENCLKREALAWGSK